MSDLSEKKAIVKLYRVFYQKEPIFLAENYESLTIEIQSMFYILNYFGMSSYTFSYNALENMNMPISLDLQDLIVKLINQQEVISADEFNNPTLLQRASEIAQKINELLNENEDKLETLRLITSIMHSKTSMYPTYNEQQIADLNNCELEIVQKVNKLSLKPNKEDIVCDSNKG